MKNEDSHFGIIASFTFLSKYIRKYKRSFVLFSIGWFTEGILQLMLPILFGVLIDEMVYYKNLDTFFNISLVILLFSLFLCSLYFVIYTFFNHIVGKYTFDIKMDLYDHLMSLRNEYVNEAKSGDIITTIQTYTNECVMIITRNLVYTFYSTLMIVLFSTYIILVNWKIGVIFLIFVPISAFITLKSGKITRRYSSKYRTEYGKYVGWLFDILNGNREIKLLGAQNFIRRIFIRNQKKLFQLEIKKSVANLHLSNLVEVINTCMQLAIFGIGAYFTINGSLTVGSLIVIVAFFTEINNNIVYLHSYYVDLQDRLTAVKYIKNFKDRPVESEAGKKKLCVHRGEVEFKNIGFSYSGSTIFNNFSMLIRPGEKVALVGESGSGKTTLVNMLIAFFKPDRGSIYIDGCDIAEYTLKSIRESIGFVQQNTFIFDGTIRDNIKLGNLKATENEITEACEKTGVLSFVKNLDNGLETVIGSKGIQLSGGQKQLIAITRIYLKNPPIVVLDEATSSLDKETEHKLIDSWERVFFNKTLIVISHNIASVNKCNRVIMIEKGKVVEEGSPKNMYSNERFKELFAI
ncbi:ABC transporter ATP-binding protein/permease [Lederbergia sp. NSJ-179]|uniref:ABC transporter ATP-binding protein n=1 Tax=Lederbergia sp. NSJ-179 TaxID=2931402 RepID=UPI001FD453D8|nr:ABC transporter ATP-binding protein [Lederbergia sp. NSJ-179]MCJ7843613.1 ABC transporter ATP-binding protein/permease [Lederbergia sp. NSJ-179]